MCRFHGTAPWDSLLAVRLDTVRERWLRKKPRVWSWAGLLVLIVKKLESAVKASARRAERVQAVAYWAARARQLVRKRVATILSWMCWR
jgi:LmbE family N-acetylglucosaminyl deacetylase